MLLQPVILPGGPGNRLWPLSREKHPKQLLAFIREVTMLQAITKHVSDFNPTMFASCNEVMLQAQGDFFACLKKDFFCIRQIQSLMPS
jgi:mannose-1-phosphate guanylyltransferase